MTNDQPKPELSIIIVNWNTREFLRACLRSIYATLDPISFEVIVADNASDDGSAEMVSSDFPEVLLVRNNENVGFAAANNIGLRRARGEFVMLLNPDTELCPNSAARMLDFMKSRPDAGLAGPKLISSSGKLQKSGRRFPSFFSEVLCITRLFRVVRPWHDAKLRWGRLNFDANVEVDEVSGACMLIRKAALDQVGLLDERFFMYYEDVDLCYRLKKAGWKVYFLGEAPVIHIWAQGALKMGVLGATAMMYRSQYLYFLKHHGFARALGLRILSALLLLVLRAKYAVFPPRINNQEPAG